MTKQEDKKKDYKPKKKLSLKELAALRGCTVGAMLAIATKVGDGKAADIKVQDPNTFKKEIKIDKPAEQKIPADTISPFKINLDNPIKPNTDEPVQEEPKVDKPSENEPQETPSAEEPKVEEAPEYQTPPQEVEDVSFKGLKEEFGQGLLDGYEDYISNYDDYMEQHVNMDPEDFDKEGKGEDKLELYGEAIALDFMSKFEKTLPAFEYIEKQTSTLDSLSNVMAAHSHGSPEHDLASNEMQKLSKEFKKGTKSFSKEMKKINNEMQDIKNEVTKHSKKNSDENDVADNKKMDNYLKKIYKQAKNYISNNQENDNSQQSGNNVSPQMIINKKGGHCY